jgi:uncharacterized membrane protein YfcA
MPQEVVLVIIGLLAGILSGMFGIGGGVVIVPALMGALAFTIHQATGTSLAALLLPVGIFAVIEYYRKGYLSVSNAALISGGLFAGSWFGARIALGLETFTLQRIYAVFLLYVFWRFTEPIKWFNEIQAKSKAKEGETSKPKEPETPQAPQVSWYVILIIGSIAGVMSGMFGIGGGLVIVPALVALLHFDQKRAVGTSLAALLLPASLPAVIQYYQAGELNITAAALVAGGLLFGALAGARIALGLPSSTIKRLYGIFLLFIAFRFMFPELFLN